MLGDIIMGKDVRTNLDIVTRAHVGKVLIESVSTVRGRRCYAMFTLMCVLCLVCSIF